ncbi:acylphosphatase [Candidatus Parcubacteria bacterium]|nr:MAG: acylphosphatase [Candidatus Parcubacteria bacterium]
MEQSSEQSGSAPRGGRIRIAMRITGRVQGVIFRQGARRQALALGITGFARNNADGTVLIVAEGEREALDAFTAWCRSGPPLARVDSLDLEPASAGDTPFTDFEIQ